MNIPFVTKTAANAVRVWTVLFCLFLLSFTNLRAVSKTWSSTGSTDWSTAGNWSPSGVPGINDTVFFSSGSINCQLPSSSFSIQRIYLNGSYSGTVTLGSGAITVTSTSRGFTQSSGSFSGNSAAIVISGPFSLTGGTFSASGSPITIAGAFTQSGGTLNLNTSTTTFESNVTFNNSALTFNAGTSLVQLTKACTLSVSNEPVISFYKFSLAPTVTTTNFTFSSSGSSTIRISEEMIYGGNKSMQTNGDSLILLKHLTVSNVLGNTVGGTSVLYLMGSANCDLKGDAADYVCGLPKVVINKSGATITATKNLTFAKGFIVTAGTLVCDNTSMFCFINSQAITVSADINDVQFSVGAYTISTPINAKGSFRSRGSSGNVTLNGTVYVEKDVTIINGFATTNAGSGKLVLRGSADQKIIGNTVNGNGKLCSIEIDKTGGSVSLLNIISVMGSWTVINGTVSAESSSSVWFTQLSGGAATNIDMRNSSGSLQTIASFGVASGTITLTDDLNLSANLGILSGATLNSNNKNISVGSNWTNTGGTFTAGTGSVTFTGSGNKAITKTVSGVANTETFTNLVFNRESGRITLGSIVQVNTSMTLTRGTLISSSGKYLSFVDNATCSGGGDGAYVCGPVRKTGNDAFVFPLGDTLLVDSVAWHPLGMSAPAAVGDVFEAVYRAVGQSLGSTLDANLQSLSTTEYWQLQRISGTSAVTTTLNWNLNSSVNNLGALRVASWSGTQWSDLGQASLLINWPKGAVTSTSSVLFVSNVATLTTATTKETPAYASLQQVLDGGYYSISNNSLFFKLADEYNDPGTILSYRILNANNVNVVPSLATTANNTGVTKYGDNLVRLDLFTTSGPLTSGIYILEVTTQKNETFYLRFLMP